MGPKVHVSGVEPAKEGFPSSVLALDEILSCGAELVVAGFHALLGERTGVLDLLPADFAETRIDRRIVLIGRVAVKNPARSEPLAKFRKILFTRVVGQFRLLFRVEVIQIAKEFIETVDSGEILVAVPEVVLAELTGRVAPIFKQFRDGWVFRLQTDGRGGHTHLGETGSVTALPGDERGSPGRTALLAVGVGKHHAFFRKTVNVRCAISHQSVAITAQVGYAYVVAPNYENVRLVWCRCLRHGFLSLTGRLGPNPFRARSRTKSLKRIHFWPRSFIKYRLRRGMLEERLPLQDASQWQGEAGRPKKREC